MRTGKREATKRVIHSPVSEVILLVEDAAHVRNRAKTPHYTSTIFINKQLEKYD